MTTTLSPEEQQRVEDIKHRVAAADPNDGFARDVAWLLNVITRIDYRLAHVKLEYDDDPLPVARQFVWPESGTVYCDACRKIHVVEAGELQCSPGAWCKTAMEEDMRDG